MKRFTVFSEDMGNETHWGIYDNVTESVLSWHPTEAEALNYTPEQGNTSRFMRHENNLYEQQGHGAWDTSHWTDEDWDYFWCLYPGEQEGIVETLNSLHVATGWAD